MTTVCANGALFFSPQVLDSSRSDWWLVVLTDSHVKGWVPANYLERQVLEGPSSPPPEPFIDETGELQRVMLKWVPWLLLTW